MARYLRSIISAQSVFLQDVQPGNYELVERIDQWGPRVGDYTPDEVDKLPPWLICDFTLDPNGHSGNVRLFPLTDHPTLHREFANLKDDAQIVQFASKYGFLGYRMYFNKHGSNGDKIVIGESLRKWQEEIIQFRSLLDRWDACMIASDKDYERNMHKIWEAINIRLKRYVYPQILPKYDQNIYLFPTALDSALYLLFVREIRGETKPTYCPGCHKWFDPKRRRDAKTCGPKCRQRVSRAKRRAT